MTSHSTKRQNARRAFLAAWALSAALPLAAFAQGRYPERPITLVVPFAPGGIADVTARAVAESMTKTLGQPVVVDNRPSAGSIVASQAVASAKPDGHTLLLMTNSNAVSVGLFKKLPYDTVKDLAPVSTLGYFDLGVFVTGGSRFASLRDLLLYAKEHPGELNVGTIAVGSTQHLAGQLFKSVAGIDVLAVPYKGSPAVLVALRSGEVDVALEIVGPMVPQVKSGAVRLLAVTGDRPNPALPSAPTAQQAGLPGYNVASWNAIAAPAGTPAPVMERLNQAVREALASPSMRSQLEPLGVRLQPSTPAEARALVVNEIKRWGDVIRAAKIEPQ
jgi:tripartite-type tricarboxylate transporter receptor subunit TctC